MMNSETDDILSLACVPSVCEPSFNKIAIVHLFLFGRLSVLDPDDRIANQIRLKSQVCNTLRDIQDLTHDELMTTVVEAKMCALQHLVKANDGMKAKHIQIRAWNDFIDNQKKKDEEQMLHDFGLANLTLEEAWESLKEELEL